MSKESYEHKLYKHCEEKEADAVAWAFVNKEKMVKFPFKFPPIAPNEVRANILYAGLCHSDVMTVREHWGPAMYPIAPGHEIIGEVSLVGSVISSVRDVTDLDDLLRVYGDEIDMTPEESWRTYLRESSMGIVVGGGAREVYQVLDMIYNPGVRVRYNEQKGLTTFPNYFGNTAYDTQTLMENDMKDALAIKIADTTSGMFEFDPATAGGLRFGSNGYLAVRVNNNNHYSSALPIKNNPAHIDDLSTGSRGLRIYNTDYSTQFLLQLML